MGKESTQKPWVWAARKLCKTVWLHLLLLFFFSSKALEYASILNPFLLIGHYKNYYLLKAPKIFSLLFYEVF